MASSIWLHILGSGSAMPTSDRLSSAQALHINGKLYLIDCSEGTQRQLRIHHLAFGRLQAIFISHLHGDHCLGLPGLLSTLCMMGHVAPLVIVGPKGITHYVRFIQEFFLEGCSYPIDVREVDDRISELVFQDRNLFVRTLPLKHRIETVGYLFTEETLPRHINATAVQRVEVPYCYYRSLQLGRDYIDPMGICYKNESLTHPALPPRSYAYCSDTLFVPELASLLQGVTLLYHEATYGDDHADRLSLTGHSSARQAGMMAQLCGADYLLIGHYSSRYSDVAPLWEQAKEEFANSIAASDGMILYLEAGQPHRLVLEKNEERPTTYQT